MKYLSFDIECCDGTHICEFGYVLFDEGFTLLKKECILINPETVFTLRGRTGGKDLTLAFPENLYFTKPAFPAVYPKIKDLLEDPETCILGFALRNDAEFLRVACERYRLPLLVFTYYDCQRLYRDYSSVKNNMSLQAFTEELGVGDLLVQHRSDEDAYAVVLGLKKISEKEGLSFPQTLEMLKKRSRNYQAEPSQEPVLSLPERLKAGKRSDQREYTEIFIRHVSGKNTEKNDYFSGKAVSVSGGFEKYRYNEFLTLIEKLYRVGATFCTKLPDCDVFICEETETYDERRVCMEDLIKNGKKADLISVREALEKLGVGESDLSAKDNIDVEEYLAEMKERILSYHRHSTSNLARFFTDNKKRPRKK